MYEVRAKNGAMRPCTLRDARKLGLYPGVTSIIKSAAAPGLERWKQDQVLMAALTLPRIDGESNDALCARILADSQEQARKARERGTEIHAAIQGHYEGKPPDEALWPHVKGVAECIRQNCGEQQWIAERPCAHGLGFGTKADLHSIAYVLDFKGSDFTEEDAPKLKTWDEHAMQLAATREALTDIDDLRRQPIEVPRGERACAIVYVSRIVPGLCRLIWIDEADLRRGWEMFCGLHTYWCGKSNYYPALWNEREAA